MKIKQTRVFLLVHRICHFRVIVHFKVFSFYYIVKSMEACEQNISRTASVRVMIVGSRIVSKL